MKLEAAGSTAQQSLSVNSLQLHDWLMSIYKSGSQSRELSEHGWTLCVAAADLALRWTLDLTPACPRLCYSLPACTLVPDSAFMVS